MKKIFDLTGYLGMSGKDGGLTVRELVFENGFADDEQPVAVRINAVDKTTGDLSGVALCVKTATCGLSPGEILEHIRVHGDLELHEVPVIVRQAWLYQFIGRIEITLVDRSAVDAASLRMK